MKQYDSAPEPNAEQSVDPPKPARRAERPRLKTGVRGGTPAKTLNLGNKPWLDDWFSPALNG
ncbi:MAG TPA: hypothetical protein VFS00_20500 [Polyangiaceae bacterium]|nr:hypothetical protein [Polyangiaceae bacterium]